MTKRSRPIRYRNRGKDPAVWALRIYVMERIRDMYGVSE